MSVNMLLISGAVKAGTSKTGKKIITAIASSFAIIVFLLIAFTTNVLSIFLNVGHVNLNNFDAKGTPIYILLHSIVGYIALGVAGFCYLIFGLAVMKER